MVGEPKTPMRRRLDICFNTSTTLRRILSTKLVNQVHSSTSWKSDIDSGDIEIMKPSNLLPFATAAASAVALPEGATRQQAPMQTKSGRPMRSMWEGLPTRDDVLATLDGAVDSIGGAVWHAAGVVTRTKRMVTGYLAGEEDFVVTSTAEPPSYTFDNMRPSQKGIVDRSTDRSVIEIIQQSNRATYFSKLLNSYHKLRDMLGDEEKEFTVFVPTDDAFQSLEGFERSEGALLGQILDYHVLEGRYPVDDLRDVRTLPTVLEENELGGRRQKLRVAEGDVGVEASFYGRVLASESKEGRNGVVHYVDGVLVPPPRYATLVDALPEQLGTFSRAMEKVGRGGELHAQAHDGVTLFAPSDDAWARLGDDVKRFLFSETGREWLRALLRYHVAEGVMYTDVEGDASEGEKAEERGGNPESREALTLLGSKVSIVVERPRVSRVVVRVNGVEVSVRDVPARDGVVHILDGVLLPPAPVEVNKGKSESVGPVDVEELKRRLGRFMKEGERVQAEEL